MTLLRHWMDGQPVWRLVGWGVVLTFLALVLVTMLIDPNLYQMIADGLGL